MLPSFAEEAPIWNLDRPALITYYYVPLVKSFSPHVPGNTLVTTCLFRSTLWTSPAFLLTLSS